MQFWLMYVDAIWIGKIVQSFIGSEKKYEWAAIWLD